LCLKTGRKVFGLAGKGKLVYDMERGFPISTVSPVSVPEGTPDHKTGEELAK
jgi:hypothetical protein